MNPKERNRFLVILAVVAIFVMPLVIYGPLSNTEGERAIPLGLDLSGGVDVQVTVDLENTAREELERIADRIRAEMRRTNISARRITQTPEGDDPGLILRLINPAQDAAATAQLLERFVDEGTLQEIGIAGLQSEAGVILRLDQQFLAQRGADAVESSRDIIKRRVDSLGVAQSDVRSEGTNHIRVQLPGQQDPERVINNLIRPATLEFRLVYPDDNPDQNPFPKRMEDLLETLITETGGLRPGVQLPEGYVVMQGDPMQDASLRNHPQRRQGVHGIDPLTGNGVARYLVADEPEIRGEHMRSVRATQGGQFGTDIVVAFELNPEGQRLFRDTTEAHKPTIDNTWRLAIVLEGTIRSAPLIESAIPFGRGQISGNFSIEEARDLQNILRAGSLPAKLVIGETSQVGPSLGADSIRAGLRASALGALLVVLFMILYYAGAGVIAVFAVAINVLLVLGMLSMLRATLTLPGIAGIILTVGMAVDANVLIFERIREELRTGKSLRNALELGFSRAFSAIFDANVTTLITALVLLQFGFGPVRGFALTMTFGIIATLFTGLFVTQVFLAIAFAARQRISIGKAHFLTDPKFHFMRIAKPVLILSAALIIASLADLAVNRGPHLGVDFTGGLQTEVAADREIGRSEVEQALVAAGFLAPRVQVIERTGIAHDDSETPVPGGAVEDSPAPVSAPSGAVSEVNFLIRIPESEVVSSVEGSEPMVDTERRILSAIRGAFPDVEAWSLGSRGVSAETGAHLRLTAIWITILAGLGIFVYVAIRFDRIYSAAALVAVVHDVFITLGVITLFNVDLSLDVVAALLTILGYSLNDTIIVFDRIRENHHLMEGRDFRDVIDNSINQVLSRTLVTSGTTLLAVGALLVLGGPGVFDFALTLFIGFVIGTYSSVFIASPIVDWGIRRRRRIAETTA
jgi:SecD/SecF fusion protein